MLPEISLNVLDIAENSIKAGASTVEIDVTKDVSAALLTVRIADDGSGMDEQQLAMVVDPFFTSRSTRKVGLGIPFFKQAAEITGGYLSIESTLGVGTVVTAVFHMDHIDCMPLGNLTDSIYSLILMNETTHFVYRYTVAEAEFVLDTEELHAILGEGISFQEPEVSAFLLGYLRDNTEETDASSGL